MKIGGFCLFLILILSGGVTAQRKAAYDLHPVSMEDIGQRDPVTLQQIPSSLLAPADGASGNAAPLRKTGAGGIDRTALENPFTAATLLRGGYFTFGTTAGVSVSRLDDQCQITFGHPYALTSFVLLQWDGIWYGVEEFFSPMEQALAGDGDTIRLVCEREGLCRLEIRIVQNVVIGRMTLSAELRNLDSGGHDAALAMQIDAALGRAGDAALYIDAVPIERDTTLVPGDAATLLLQERAGVTRAGLRAAIRFHGELPRVVAAGNWQPALGDVFDPHEGRPRQLFDLVLRPEWHNTQLAPGAATTASLSLDLPAPDFTAPAFMRCDMPTALSIDRGALFPREFSVLVQTWNDDTAPFAFTRLAAPFPDGMITGTKDLWNVSAPGQDYGFTTLSFRSSETFEELVVPVTIRCVAQGITLDSLTRWVYIPAVAMTDTGLTVAIDTVSIAALPQVDLDFRVTEDATGTPVLGVKPEHVWLYENGTRLRDFTLTREGRGDVAAVDVVFVFDVTGSMIEEIKAVRDNIIEFSEALSGAGISFRLGMITFGDEIRGTFPFTQDITRFQSDVGKQTAKGGGDTPENSLAALYEAARLPFRPEAHRVFVWITDANFHEKNSKCPYTVPDVVNALLAQAVTVHCIGAEWSREAYERVTGPTGGQYFDITGNFRDILLEISDFNVSTVYRLIYRTPNPGADPRSIELAVHYAGKGGGTTWVSKAPAGGLDPASAEAELLCYPNPFNPAVNIRLRDVGEGTGYVSVVDAAGRELERFAVDGSHGDYAFEWNAGRMSSGVYFIRLRLEREGGSLLQKSATVVYAK